MQETIKDVNNQLETIPYFYIIKHKASGRKYAGCRFAKNCNPSELLQENGYKTSSNTIRKIITEEGLESFEIVEIVTDFGQFDNAYDYETFFLNDNNCSEDHNWFNYHNNSASPAFGSDAHKKLMMDKYGVDSYSKTEECQEKMKITCIEKYGDEFPIRLPEIRQKSIITSLTKYNCEFPCQSDIVKENIRNSNIEKYNYAYTMQVPIVKEKTKQTCMEKFGSSSYLNSEKHKNDFKHCSYCNESFLTQHYIRFHGENCIKNPDVISYTCNFCNFTTLSLTTYETKHGENCSKNKNSINYSPKPINVCLKCFKIYSHKPSLMYHLNKCSETNGNRPNYLFTCHYCLKTYDDIDYFKTHHDDNCIKNPNHPKFKITPEKYIKCDFCDDMFSSYNTLSKHIKKQHLVNRHFDCPYCDNIYKTKESLSTHIKKFHF